MSLSQICMTGLKSCLTCCWGFSSGLGLGALGSTDLVVLICLILGAPGAAFFIVIYSLIRFKSKTGWSESYFAVSLSGLISRASFIHSFATSLAGSLDGS